MRMATAAKVICSKSALLHIWCDGIGAIKQSSYSRSFRSSAAALGGPRPWRKYSKVEVVHQSQKPQFERDIEFSSIGLKYPMKYTPDKVIELTGWTKPHEIQPNEYTKDLPFFVERTDIGKSLPVYTELLHGRTKLVTVLRRCKGDVKLLKEDMEKVIGQEVIVRPGKLVAEGNYVLRLKKWLVGLGF